jgi:hypothetical protein
MVGRGAAFGDIDNDGDIDVVIGNNSGAAQLLINEKGQMNHWIGLRVTGARGRDMLGARVAVTAGDRTYWRRSRSDGSYASANDPRVLVGLGATASVTRVRVIWPDGRDEQFGGIAADKWTTLKEGAGTPCCNR